MAVEGEGEEGLMGVAGERRGRQHRRGRGRESQLQVVVREPENRLVRVVERANHRQPERREVLLLGGFVRQESRPAGQVEQVRQQEQLVVAEGEGE